MEAGKTRILVLSVSAGAGHVRAAAALEAQAKESFPTVEIKHIDLMTLVSPAFRKLYSEFYIKLVEHHPSLWAYLYRVTDRMPRDAVMAQVRRSVERLNTRALDTTIEDFAPQHIVCTHFLPTELLSNKLRRGRDIPRVWVQVTDFDLHRMWVQPHMHGYFTANDEVAFRLTESGIPADRVHVTGIPIMPVFTRALDRAACRAELGLNAQRFTLLLTSGGAGLASGGSMLERLLALPGDFQMIALAGKNAALLERYQDLAKRFPNRVAAIGLTNTIERLMAASDIAVTKPGGLTVSECIAMELPMLLISPIPGQEERNADYLLEHGAALKAHDATGLEFRVKQLLAEPSRLSAMAERLRAIQKPSPASAVLRNLLPQSAV